MISGKVGGGGDARAAIPQHPHAQATAFAGAEIFQGAILNLGLAAPGHRDEGFGPIGAQAEGVLDAILEALFEGFRNKRAKYGFGHQGRASRRTV